jgi:hypothetical protein
MINIMAKAKKDKIEEQLEEMPEITKNEVIKGSDFYKEIKKYEGETPLGPLIVAIIIVIAAIILAIIFL